MKLTCVAAGTIWIQCSNVQAQVPAWSWDFRFIVSSAGFFNGTTLFLFFSRMKHYFGLCCVPEEDENPGKAKDFAIRYTYEQSVSTGR